MDERQTIEQRKTLMKRLRMTGRNETICLMDWQVALLIEWIEELQERTKGNE